MSKFFSKLQLNPKHQRILSFIFYALFAALIIYNILNSSNNVHKMMYLILLFITLGFALFSEYLKLIYEKAIKELTFELDPIKASNTYSTLLSKDKAKAYKNSKIIFDTMVYLDQQDYNHCQKLLNDNDKFFHSSLDQLLIFHFTQFMIDFYTNNETRAKEEYKKMIRMKESKIKGMKVSPLYNWEMLEGMYQFIRKDYKQSINTLKTVNTSYMNPRECAQYYYVCAKIAKTSKDNSFYESNLRLLKALNGKSKTCKGDL